MTPVRSAAHQPGPTAYFGKGESGTLTGQVGRRGAFTAAVVVSKINLPVSFGLVFQLRR